MKKILLAIAVVLMDSALSLRPHAKLPAAPPKSDAEKAAEADKAARGEGQGGRTERQRPGQGGGQLQEEQGHRDGHQARRRSKIRGQEEVTPEAA